MSLNRRLPPVRQDMFSMVPRADVPRSRFSTRHTLKTTFDVNYLVPILVDEALPGDDWRARITMFCRMTTPLFPVMDNVHLETFFFFVPARLVWTNWKRFMGERDPDPTSSIAYTLPQIPSPATGWASFTIADYFGLPIAGELVLSKSVNSLPFRAYWLIWNEWFRDQNLQSALVMTMGDGPDPVAWSNGLAPRAKRHDYFTSALPWPTKNNVLPAIPLSGFAPIRTTNPDVVTGIVTDPMRFRQNSDGAVPGTFQIGISTQSLFRNATAFTGAANAIYPSNLVADLSGATGATINAMRLAVATQQLLERDARGGTRYIEILQMHFGVTPQDYRLQRPEYIGGGSMMLETQAIPQTAPSDVGATDTTVGELGGATTGSGRHGFSYQCMEHGYIIGLANVFGDVTYQRGVHRMWTRSTRLDFYFPTFAHLGEQVVRNDEIWSDGSANDVGVFGYQERYAEYRYKPGRITGAFRSNATASLDTWHLAQDFAVLPTLSDTFIRQSTPIDRVAAAASLAVGQQFLFDSVWDISITRPLPLRSVPGLLRL